MSNLHDAIVAGSLEKAIEATKMAVEEGVAPQDIINLHMVKGMEEIGRRFEEGKAFVPNLLLSARAMRGALDLLKPLLTDNTDTYVGKVVIGTVKGDLHDIGKNLVASMFEGCGFEVINLGADVPSSKFIEATIEHKPDIVCMSALLTTTMNYMKTVIEELEKAGLRDSVKVMVGGAPLNEEFAKHLGADVYTSNANAAVTAAKELLTRI